MKVTASDADDPTYGSSARVVYSVLDGEKIFTVDRHTGKKDDSDGIRPPAFVFVLLLLLLLQNINQCQSKRPQILDQSKSIGHHIKLQPVTTGYF